LKAAQAAFFFDVQGRTNAGAAHGCAFGTGGWQGRTNAGAAVASGFLPSRDTCTSLCVAGCAFGTGGDATADRKQKMR
jgi:hypothetical protein